MGPLLLYGDQFDLTTMCLINEMPFCNGEIFFFHDFVTTLIADIKNWRFKTTHKDILLF